MKQYNNRMITNTEVIFWCIAVYKNINIIKKKNPNQKKKKKKSQQEVNFFAFSIKAINIIIMYVFIHIFKLFFCKTKIVFGREHFMFFIIF